MTGPLVFGMNPVQSKCSIDIFLIKEERREGKGGREGGEKREAKSKGDLYN